MTTTRYWSEGRVSSHWHWPNFSPREMFCRKTGELRISEEFMDKLQAIRNALGFPLAVSSGYRTPEYNAEISSTGLDGPHTTGQAADILIFGPRALQLIAVAPDLGMTGVGVSQRGAHEGRFIHLDDLPNAPSQPRPWLWGY